jgi:hypothetical protein
MKCSICKSESKYLFEKTLLKRYKVKYFKCDDCGFIETEKPRYWLRKAYSSALIDSDTGIIGRNITLSKIAALIFLLFCKKDSMVLDYAGGYGIMTRMLRDVGVDCYWEDKYAENIFAKQFAHKKGNKYSMVTAFEFFEHLDDPVREIRQIITEYSPKILLFSTTLHNGNPPKDWWYFVEGGGQHISLYTAKSLGVFASKLNMKYSTNGVNIHIFSKIKIPSVFMQIISISSSIYSMSFPLFFRSKTYTDHLVVK